MTRLLIAFTLLATTFAAAETFHVVGVRTAASGDARVAPSPGQMLAPGPLTVYVVTGTIGSTKYTAQQSAALVVRQQFEVGKDYEVVHRDAEHMIVIMVDRRGKNFKQHLTVVGAEEQH